MEIIQQIFKLACRVLFLSIKLNHLIWNGITASLQISGNLYIIVEEKARRFGREQNCQVRWFYAGLSIMEFLWISVS